MPNDVTFIPSTETGLKDQGNNWYSDDSSHWLDNTYTIYDWKKMENAGAVFLPAAGYRIAYNVYNVQFEGDYWYSTAYNGDFAYNLCLYSYGINPQDNVRRYYGYSVRLVQDVK